MRSFIPDELRTRTRPLNRRRSKRNRSYILCWLQQALRGQDNPIIDVSIAIANELKLPVVVYHGLDNRYPHASLRLHRFILEASRSLQKDVEGRGLRFCRYVRRTAKRESGLVYRLAESAACIVTDDMPTFVARRQAASVASRSDVPVYVVDAACLVPMNCFPARIDSTRAFRAAHRALRSASVAGTVELEPNVHEFDGDLCFEHDELPNKPASLDKLVGECGIDMTVPVAADFPGDRSSAMCRLHHAVEHVVPRYKWTRNNPADPNSTSKLSPYLHFGVLGPREIVRAIESADLHPAARWKFLDELLTWREYYHHLARFSEFPDGYENVLAWARQSLADHASDRRPVIYSLSQLLHAETEDPVWNAAQRQFLLDGWMHNNLRMYWVKQIIKWSETPEQAWQRACYLNDRLSLDGRDPSTYGGIQWGFGQSRKGYREVPIYGWVPTKISAALMKRPKFSEWVTQMNEREKIAITVS